MENEFGDDQMIAMENQAGNEPWTAILDLAERLVVKANKDYGKKIPVFDEVKRRKRWENAQPDADRWQFSARRAFLDRRVIVD
jgi:hypothetical protein